MNDDQLLHEIYILGEYAENSEAERVQMFRLISEGFLERIPVSPIEGDAKVPLVCRLTPLGRRRIGR